MVLVSGVVSVGTARALSGNDRIATVTAKRHDLKRNDKSDMMARQIRST